MSEKQLCWSCKLACGHCPWSSTFEPVPGWTAIKQRNGTYEIKKCPLYKQDDKRSITVEQMGVMLGCTGRAVSRRTSLYLKREFENLGYQLFVELVNRGVGSKPIRRFYIRKIKKQK